MFYTPRKNRARHITVLGCLLTTLLFVSSGFCAKSTTITVHQGETHTFRGLGAGTTEWHGLNSLPQEVIDSAAKLIYTDCDFRIAEMFEMYYSKDKTASKNNGRFAKWYKAVKAAQPNLELWMMAYNADVTLTDNNHREYAASKAQLIKELREDYGFDFKRTSLWAEANNASNKLNENNVANILKLFDEEFKARGLGDILFHAPQCSNIDNTTRKMLDAIIADKEALDILDGFAFQSYTMGMEKWVDDKIAPYGKDRMVTEAAFWLGGWETEGYSTHYGTDLTARFLTDLNLGINFWIWFEDMYCTKPNRKSSNRIIEIDPTTHEFYIYLKYYYLKHISRAFKVGTKIRSCTSDQIPEWDGHKSRYYYMEFNYGHKVPINAAAGRNPDGAWVLASVNGTGCGYNNDTLVWEGETVVTATYDPPSPYDVTFHVEELANSGSVKFNVLRTSKYDTLKDAGTVTMQNGDVTVTVNPREFVTLHEDSPSASLASTSNVKKSNSDLFLVTGGDGSRQSFSIRYSVPASTDNVTQLLSLSVHDLCGKLIKTLVSEKPEPGLHITNWNRKTHSGKPVGSGVYVLRMQYGSKYRNARIVF